MIIEKKKLWLNGKPNIDLVNSVDTDQTPLSVIDPCPGSSIAIKVCLIRYLTFLSLLQTLTASVREIDILLENGSTNTEFLMDGNISFNKG